MIKDPAGIVSIAAFALNENRSSSTTEILVTNLKYKSVIFFRIILLIACLLITGPVKSELVFKL
jgi:hypothetical protein